MTADVPQKSPTVRGLVALVIVGVNGATPADVIGLPDDLLSILGLNGALGMNRQQGFRGLIARLKQAVQAGTAD